MYVDIYTTLTVLALLVAPYIYDISRLRVNCDPFFYLSFNNVLYKAVPTQDVNKPASLPSF